MRPLLLLVALAARLPLAVLAALSPPGPACAPNQPCSPGPTTSATLLLPYHTAPSPSNDCHTITTTFSRTRVVAQASTWITVTETVYEGDSILAPSSSTN